MSKLQNISLIFLSIFICALSVNADSWALPEEKTYCSKNNKFCFKVIPKKLESQLSYFQDKVDEKQNAGADKKVKENYCKGIFYVRDDKGILRERWKQKLVNEVSPVSVLVSDEGNYVITFDNWHNVGYGDDTVVIYEASKGDLIKKLALSDFLTENDIYNLPTSTSSIWWGGEHYIDKAKNHLILKVTKGGRSFEKDADYFTVSVELSTGKIIDEKRNRLPSLQFTILPLETDIPETPATPATDNSANCFNGAEYKKLSSTDFLKEAVSQEKPAYSPAAKAVRATGKIIVEVLVGENGDVECVRLISGHPLLRNSVLTAIKKWKFRTSATKYSGFIAFEAKSMLVSPDGKIIE